MFMSQNVGVKAPKILLKNLSEHYAHFQLEDKYIAVLLDKMPQIEEGVYKVEVFSIFCIVDTNVPIPHEGRELEVVA